jgi:hypothetical protein
MALNVGLNASADNTQDWKSLYKKQDFPLKSQRLDISIHSVHFQGFLLSDKGSVMLLFNKSICLCPALWIVTRFEEPYEKKLFTQMRSCQITFPAIFLTAAEEPSYHLFRNAHT